MSLWANVFLGNRLSGQMSFWANVIWTNVFLGKYLSGQMSFWANVFLGKCLSGKMSSGQMSFWANVFLGKFCLGKCPSGQMSFRANVSRQMSLGKCRMGKCHGTHLLIHFFFGNKLFLPICQMSISNFLQTRLPSKSRRLSGDEADCLETSKCSYKLLKIDHKLRTFLLLCRILIFLPASSRT
jgi:hypothetical protein